MSDQTKTALNKRSRRILGMALLYFFLIQLVFVIVFPFITRISASFMSSADMFDRTVNLIPRFPTLANYRLVMDQTNYWGTVFSTFMLSGVAAILQTFICAMTGYALAKIRGRLGQIVLIIVLISVLVPPQVILVPLYLNFRFFDVFGVLGLTGAFGGYLNLMDSMTPIVLLSLTGFAFKNGLYIFIMRQFFKGVPEELEEAAMVDGSSVFRAYLRVVLPISIPMLITIFMLAFSWQWTDSFYSGIFFNRFPVLSRAIFNMRSVGGNARWGFEANTLLHTGVLMALFPLVALYAVAQKWLTTGIERSGIVG